MLDMESKYPVVIDITRMNRSVDLGLIKRKEYRDTLLGTEVFNKVEKEAYNDSSHKYHTQEFRDIVPDEDCRNNDDS